MRLTGIVFMIIAASFASACKKSEDKAASTGSDEAVAAKPTDQAAKLSYKKLGSLGLEAELPDGADIQDTTKGAGYPSATIYAATLPTTFLSGPGEMSDVKPTLEDSKARFVKDALMNLDSDKRDAAEAHLKPTREEKTADGWILEMSGAEMGDTIAVSVRRTFDGKPWDCGSRVKSKDEVAQLEKFCKSVRVAK